MNAKEQFTRLPWRIMASLSDGELTRDECLTLIYLADQISRRWRTPRKPFITELAVIKAETGWGMSPRRLDQLLKSLETKGWISTQTRLGRKKWEIALTGARIDGDEEKAAKQGRSDFELSSKQHSSRRHTNTDGERETTVREARNATGALDVDPDADVDQPKELSDEEVVGEAASRTHGERALSDGPSFNDLISVDDLALLDRIGDEVFSTQQLRS